MSLIVAKNDGSSIVIVSDTKLTYPEHESKRQKEYPTDGVIKTTIINTSLCISFAGETDWAEQAIKSIAKDDSFINALKQVNHYHTLSEGKTEFILCAAQPEPIIYEIKNGASRQVQSTWIGSQSAFSRFQASMLSAPKKDTSNLTYFSISESHPNEHFSKMLSAMDDVINDEEIKEVGGFRISTVYLNSKFEYAFYSKSYRNPIQITEFGTYSIGHASPQDGGYSVSFFGASSDYQSLAVYIMQGNFGIIYSRSEGELFYPKLFPNLNEVDFIDLILEKYGITAPFHNQDPFPKYMRLAHQAFKLMDFSTADAYYEKAAKKSRERRKAEALYYRGIVLLNLKRLNEAIIIFQECINLNQSYQSKVMKIILSIIQR